MRKMIDQTHRRISCSMEVGRASTPTWCRIWAKVNLNDDTVWILMGKHLLQPSEKLVQGLSKGGKGLSDNKKSDLADCSMSRLCRLTLLPRLEVSPSGCSQSPSAAAWTAPSHSSTSSASPSAAAVLGWIWNVSQQWRNYVSQVFYLYSRSNASVPLQKTPTFSISTSKSR